MALCSGSFGVLRRSICKESRQQALTGQSVNIYSGIESPLASAIRPLSGYFLLFPVYENSRYLLMCFICSLKGLYDSYHSSRYSQLLGSFLESFIPQASMATLQMVCLVSRPGIDYDFSKLHQQRESLLGFVMTSLRCCRELKITYSTYC